MGRLGVAGPTGISKPDYSLWLMPSPVSPAGRHLHGLIDRFSSLLGGPTFTPHVSLIPIIGRDRRRAFQCAQELRAHLRKSPGPRHLQVSGIGVGSTDHQCVYATFHRNDALLKLYDHAIGLSYPRDRRPYLPHLSLVYGAHARTARVDAAQHLSAMVPDVIQLDHLALWEVHADERRWRRLWWSGL